eukprot:scaffold36531_cov52-Attheya_sp.AAC.2
MVSNARRRNGGIGDVELLLPGFNMPKGLEPMLPIYQRGILIYGDSSIRGIGRAYFNYIKQIPRRAVYH